MFSTLDPQFLATSDGQEAERILRACVHCGFCLATCPTYQLLGDELDSPRGRIYLMKSLMEGQAVSHLTQRHLDRCLTCRACESTCPSGVQYGRLVDIGRTLTNTRVKRSLKDRLMRTLLKTILLKPILFNSLLWMGQQVRRLLPRHLARQIPAPQSAGVWPSPRHPRHMVVLEGCVQPALAPNINAATARLLDVLGISLIRARRAGCCGAVSQHLGDEHAALDAMRRNIDAWWPWVEEGIEAIVITASGCGTQVKEYGHLLRNDPTYSVRAQQISALTRDVSEVLTVELGQQLLAQLGASSLFNAPAQTIAFQAPCSLQHGQKIKGVVESLLSAAGATLTAVPDGHLCCGSAGTYSILQPALSHQLRQNKLKALHSGKPDLILSANIGCLTHLASGTDTPVRHWVEWLDERLAGHHQGHT